MKRAINAWAVPSGTDFETMFRTLSEIGFDAVELNVDADNSSGHSLTMETTPEELTEIAALSRQYQLPVTSISTALYWKFPLGSKDAATRAYAQDVLRAQLACARALGGDAILVVTGGIGDDTSIVECYELCRHALEELLPEIEASGILVGLENVGNGFFLSPGDMCEFIDAFESDYIRAYFDIGNVLRYSYPEYWIEILGSRICKVHAKDGRKVPSPVGYYEYPLLQGSVRWDQVMEALRIAGYEDVLTAELGASEKSPEFVYRTVHAALTEIVKL